MYEIGSFIGYWGCIVYMVIMLAGTVFVMKKYLKED
jgi:hypothetical protein